MAVSFWQLQYFFIFGIYFILKYYFVVCEFQYACILLVSFCFKTEINFIKKYKKTYLSLHFWILINFNFFHLLGSGVLFYLNKTWHLFIISYAGSLFWWIYPSIYLSHLTFKWEKVLHSPILLKRILFNVN